jgi:mRNA (guanine-N7-)-methyltransferase
MDGKQQMNIPKTKQNLIKNLFKDENPEVEARFGTFESKNFNPHVNITQYERLFSFFMSKQEFYEHSVSFQIIQFSLKNQTKKIKNVNEQFQDTPETREIYVKKTKRVNIDVTDYDIRISSALETSPEEASSYEYEETPRYRIRHTFVSNDARLKIDISQVFYKHEKTMNVELERLSGCEYSVFMNNTNLIKCIIQDTEFPISVSETKKVLRLLPRKFAGIQPRTLQCDSILSENSAITKKLDGVRYLMTTVEAQVYIIHKNGTVKKYPFTVNKPEAFKDIIFDGELFGGDYHIFDVIAAVDLNQRLSVIGEFVKNLVPESKCANIFIKEYVFTDDVKTTMLKMSKDLNKNFDGLIIVNSNAGYYECDPLKWKKLITFDFTLEYSSGTTYNLMMKGAKEFLKFGEITLENIQESGMVMECYHDGKWNVLKSRPDKDFPNYETTVYDNWKAVQTPFEMEATTPARNKSALYDMRRFHNYIKRKVISEYPSNSVLDLACGKGGDFSKYIDNNIKYIEGHDLDSESIKNANNRKEYFLSKAIYKNFNIDLHHTDLIKQEVRSSIKFDMVSCNFAYHYFYKSPENIIKSIQNNTKQGSVVILTLLDNERVVPVEGPELKIEPVEGDRISVFIKDSVLNKPRVEFLVPKKNLIEQFVKAGFKMIKCQEFSEFYKEWKKHGNSLNATEVNYSFMNNVYVFKKN